jgi:hypothetical protein
MAITPTLVAPATFSLVAAKAVVGRSWKVGSNYTEHEHLTMMMNQLAIDGLKPLFSNVITERVEGMAAQDRMVFVCEKL